MDAGAEMKVKEESGMNSWVPGLSNWMNKDVTFSEDKQGGRIFLLFGLLLAILF